MLAQAIISQYGGPDGEMGASMRYLSQRYAAPYREVASVLTDIGVSVSKLRITDFKFTPEGSPFRSKSILSGKSQGSPRLFAKFVNDDEYCRDSRYRYSNKKYGTL